MPSNPFSSNRPDGQLCAVCRFFAETVAAPTDASTGACVLNPIPVEPIRRSYWCGQFKTRGEPWARE
jgi:hypothetical protein